MLKYVPDGIRSRPGSGSMTGGQSRQRPKVSSVTCASFPEHLTAENCNMCCCLFEGRQGRKKLGMQQVMSANLKEGNIPREQWLLCLSGRQGQQRVHIGPGGVPNTFSFSQARKLEEETIGTL